jgi:hypothetical protein
MDRAKDWCRVNDELAEKKKEEEEREKESQQSVELSRVSTEYGMR